MWRVILFFVSTTARTLARCRKMIQPLKTHVCQLLYSVWQTITTAVLGVGSREAQEKRSPSREQLTQTGWAYEPRANGSRHSLGISVPFPTHLAHRICSCDGDRNSRQSNGDCYRGEVLKKTPKRWVTNKSNHTVHIYIHPATYTHLPTDIDTPDSWGKIDGIEGEGVLGTQKFIFGKWATEARVVPIGKHLGRTGLYISRETRSCHQEDWSYDYNLKRL